MKNIFLTGGAGFIGSHFANKLLENNFHVITIDNFDPFYKRSLKEKNISLLCKYKNFKLIEGDIRDKDLLSDIFKKHEFELIVHLAAKAGVRPSIEDPTGYFEVNVQGTINVLEEMRKNKVSKMLIASSSSVYGNNKKIPFSESDNVDNPISPYAASKKACELICSTYNTLYGLDITAFRFFTVYGPAQRPEMAIAKFANLILNNKPITLFDGKGSTSRDYTYIDDIVDGLYKSIDKLDGFKIYNIGESQGIKLIDLVGIIEKNLNKKAEIIFGDKQPGDVDITFADVSKAKLELGYSPKVKIEDGIKRYIDWLILNK